MSFGEPDCRKCGGYFPGNPGAYKGTWCKCKENKPSQAETHKCDACKDSFPKNEMETIKGKDAEEGYARRGVRGSDYVLYVSCCKWCERGFEMDY